MPRKTIMLESRTTLEIDDADEVDVMSILRGRYGQSATTDGRRVRRVLDIGARYAEFGAWAFHRWPGAWVDMVETRPDLAPLAQANGPPGSKLLPHGALQIVDYDVVRIADPDFLPVVSMVLAAKPPILIVDFSVVRASATQEEPKGFGYEEHICGARGA